MSQNVAPLPAPGNTDLFQGNALRKMVTAGTWDSRRCGWNGGYTRSDPDGILAIGNPCTKLSKNVFGRCADEYHQPEGAQRNSGGLYIVGRSVYRGGPPVGYGNLGGPPVGGYALYGGTHAGPPPDRSGCAPSVMAAAAAASLGNPAAEAAGAKALTTYHKVLCALVEEIGAVSGNVSNDDRLIKDAKIAACEFVEFNDLAYLAGAPNITPEIPTIPYGPRQPLPDNSMIPLDPLLPADAALEKPNKVHVRFAR